MTFSQIVAQLRADIPPLPASMSVTPDRFDQSANDLHDTDRSTGPSGGRGTVLDEDASWTESRIGANLDGNGASSDRYFGVRRGRHGGGGGVHESAGRVFTAKGDR